MARHYFGLLPHPPGSERYDTFEPERYGCIAVDDEYIELLLPEFDDIPCFWHTLQVPGNNLAYCGITLIPPESAPRFAEVFRRHDVSRYQALLSLLEQAAQEGKYIIHYGI
ncbi:MAG: hypothetical protein PUC47_00175 [Oscillospiraceae bacterium]|nr:hypothetical protein [Oscillospiraceae bacterium]